MHLGSVPRIPAVLDSTMRRCRAERACSRRRADETTRRRAGRSMRGKWPATAQAIGGAPSRAHCSAACRKFSRFAARSASVSSRGSTRCCSAGSRMPASSLAAPPWASSLRREMNGVTARAGRKDRQLRARVRWLSLVVAHRPGRRGHSGLSRRTRGLAAAEHRLRSVAKITHPESSRRGMWKGKRTARSRDINVGGCCLEAGRAVRARHALRFVRHGQW